MKVKALNSNVAGYKRLAYGRLIDEGSVALRNSKPVFQLGLSISQPKSKRLPQDPNRILPCVSVFYEPYVMFQCLQLIFVRFYRF